MPYRNDLAFSNFDESGAFGRPQPSGIIERGVPRMTVRPIRFPITVAAKPAAVQAATATGLPSITVSETQVHNVTADSPSTYAQAIRIYNQARGTNLDPHAPWNTATWNQTTSEGNGPRGSLADFNNWARAFWGAVPSFGNKTGDNPLVGWFLPGRNEQLGTPVYATPSIAQLSKAAGETVANTGGDIYGLRKRLPLLPAPKASNIGPTPPSLATPAKPLQDVPAQGSPAQSSPTDALLAGFLGALQSQQAAQANVGVPGSGSVVGATPAVVTGQSTTTSSGPGVLPIILIVAALGGVGYYFYRRSHAA